MEYSRKTLGKRISRRYTLLGALGILVLVLLIAAACGEDATPTPLPATAVPAPTAVPTGPAPTAVPGAPAPTAVPTGPAPTAVPGAPVRTAVPAPTATSVPTTGLRDRSQWTEANPATLAEIEAELEKHRGESLVWVSWGGAYQSAQRAAHIIPFEAKFGIEIIEDSPASYSKFAAQVESGNLQWHVMDVAGDFVFGFGDQVEPIDLAVVDNRDFVGVWQRGEAGGTLGAGGAETWSTVVAYSTETYPDGGLQPSMAMDFWDLEKFPGRRGWTYYHNFDLRLAQLAMHPELIQTAEGRNSLSAMTDEQVDESFAFIRARKNQASLFWATGSDCPQLLISGELDMCTAWNGRIWDAQQEGAPINVCWECGYLLSTGAWVIPKGLKEQDPDTYELANLWIAWTSFPEQNARISLFIAYGPNNMASLPFLDGPAFDEVRSELPTSAQNMQYAILEDEVYSGVTYDAQYERWVGEIMQ
ncbi:MAG: extracellular solute-binding protein [Dehalococcoidia bacterium]